MTVIYNITLIWLMKSVTLPRPLYMLLILTSSPGGGGGGINTQDCMTRTACFKTLNRQYQ